MHVAVLSWPRALLSARALPTSLFLCSRPPYTAVFCPWRFGVPVRPLLRQCRAVPFQWFVQQPGRAFLRSEAPPKCCLFSVNQLLKTVLFRLAWVGSALGRDL